MKRSSSVSEIVMSRSKKSHLSVLELRAWRDLHNLTQAEAAYILGISLRQYSNYEQGLSPITKAVKLACILITIACEDYVLHEIGFSDVRELVDEVSDSYFPEEC